MQIDLRPVHAHIRNSTPFSNEILTRLESLRHANSLNDNIKTINLTKVLLGLFADVSFVRIDGMCRAHLLCHIEPPLIFIDDHNHARRVQLCRQKRRKTYRPSTNDGNSARRSHATSEHTNLQASRQNITQHKQTPLINTFGYALQARVRVHDAHILSLSTIVRTTEAPSAISAEGVRAFLAEGTGRTLCDARDQNAVALLEFFHVGADVFDYADTFVAECYAWLGLSNFAFDNVEVRATINRISGTIDWQGYLVTIRSVVSSPDRCTQHLYDRIVWFLDLWLWLVLQSDLAGSVVYESLHDVEFLVSL